MAILPIICPLVSMNLDPTSHPKELQPAKQLEVKPTETPSPLMMSRLMLSSKDNLMRLKHLLIYYLSLNKQLPIEMEPLKK